MFCRTCNSEIQHELENCPFCGGSVSEPPEQSRYDNVITIISDYNNDNTTDTQTGKLSDASQYISHPTAFVSFGQLDSAAEVPDGLSERKFRFKYVLIPAIIIVIATLAVTWVINFMTPDLPESVSSMLGDIRTRTQASALAIAEPFMACVENGWLSADISYTDELGDTISGVVTYAASDETDMRSLSLDALIYGNPIDATMRVGENHAALGSSLLGESYYGVRFDSFAEDFEKFTSAAGLDGVSSGGYAEIVRMIDYFFNSGDLFTLPDSTISELDKIFTGFFKGLVSSVDRDRNTVIDGKRIKKIVYTYSATVTDIVNLGYKLLGLARTDGSFQDFIAAYIRYHDIYKYQISEQAPIDSYLDAYENALRHLDENCSGEITMRLVTANGRLCLAELYSSRLYLSGDSFNFGLTLDFGHTVHDDWSLICNISTPQAFFECRAIWAFSVEDGTAENMLTLIAGDGYTADTYKFRSLWEQASGVFAISVRDSSNSVNINLRGTLICNAHVFTLALDTSPELRVQFDGRVDDSYILPIEFINLDRWDSDTLDLFSRAVSELYASIYSYPPMAIPYSDTTDIKLVPN